ncbi:hypothetical protein ACIQFL_06840 [Bacillus toyonensis]|uniref:hypothetical protein n=1 Tax=Bacillus cereus group TaxID=86661 RepID=UPI000BF2F2F0|nr:hypothetical protein [Bacillus toyonensis]PFX67305.1 hypothetical protein COL35_11890 [Bacillus toyonensis]
MYWKESLKRLNEWKTIIILLVPFICMFYVEIPTLDAEEYDKYKDMVEFVSWLFAGILSLVAFATIFLAFTYENKLIIASKSLKKILKPYALNTEELRLQFSEYDDSLFGDRTINILYYTFLLTATSSLLVWGVSMGLYTQYHFAFKIDFTIGSFLVFGIYLFFCILFMLFLLIAIAINLIRQYKDPLDRGFLPDVLNIADIDYMKNKKGDLKEFTKKICPSIEIYQNPPFNNSNYELVFFMPIKVKNFRFVTTIFDSGDKQDTLIKCYGIIKEKLVREEIGEVFSYTIEKNLPINLSTYIFHNECYGEIKVYDKKNLLIARHVLKKNKKEHSVSFSYTHEASVEINDNDYNLIKYLQHSENENKFMWQIEKIFTE